MEGKRIKEFPDVDNKLQAPTKKSLFEKQKAEQEAKRLREAAETAAVYESFVKSFDDEDVAPSLASGYGYGNDRGVTGPPKRHYGSTPSGRGAPARGRGFSGPGSLGPPPSLARKRAQEGFEQQPRRRDDRGGLAFGDDYGAGPKAPRAFNASDDEDERQGGRSAEPAIPKPTLRLSNLPPRTSPAVIKALLSNLTIDAVRIMPPSGPGLATERKSMSAIVTLSKETAANDIDAAVNGLQNRYLGYGFYLSLHRHLSSSALSSAPVVSLASGAASQPFGAKPVSIDTAPSHAHAPPGQYRGIAPPTSYISSQPRTGPLLHVPVHPPRDIKELKLIHKTIELLLTHGPEFEALLMTRPEVQREEKWAWLWDARSTGGIWYRWRLWEVLTGSQTKKSKDRGRYLPLFEDSSAWKAPEAPLAFEYTTHLDEFISDSEYNSSSEDDSGDEGGARRHAPTAADPTGLDDGTTYLNPLQKAKLTHLLARLPTSTGKLRKGDVARVTAFAIAHAGRGADEVVAAIISNIEKPFAYTSANPSRPRDHDDDGGSEPEDTSSASLIGLYVASDILSSSSTSGVRHAWRYRQLIETALRARRTFERLGRLDRRLAWGRLRAEKWRRSVGNVLALWEGWCVFPQEAQEHFVRVFNNPPVTREEEERRRAGEAKAEERVVSHWKAVETAAGKERDAVVVEDVDGEPMASDEDVDGVPMVSSDDEDAAVDVDGDPMAVDVDGDPMAVDDEQEYEPPAADSLPPPEKEKPVRKRPKAEDMFADSGSEAE